MTAARLFSVTETQHYCAGFDSGVSPTTPDAAFGKGPTRLREGTPAFNVFRTALLRSTERDLFLALTHFRRSIDLMIYASAPWAYVTLYYGCFFAARSILGIFGARLGAKFTIDVESGTPGQQVLERSSVPGRAGSHRRLWSVFYPSVASLRPWVSPEARLGLSPVLGDQEWLIATRNDLNYKSELALDMITAFDSSFNPANFPSSLPGDLNTMFSVCQSITLAATEFWKLASLASDGLAAVRPPGDLRTKVGAMWTASAPEVPLQPMI